MFPDSEQVRRLGLENKSDGEIWDFAKKNDFTIVTFDADFYDMSLFRGHPPKVIWLKLKNSTTENIEKMLLEKYDQIHDLLRDSTLSCLEIT